MPTPDGSKEAMEHLRKVHAMQCYHGLRSRSHVEESLKEKGDYLIRMVKARKNEVVLSICLGANAEPKYAHLPVTYNIAVKLWELQVLFSKRCQGTKVKGSNRSAMEGRGTPSGNANQNMNKKALQFSTIDELIKFYRDRPLQCGVCLRMAIRRPKWLISTSALRYHLKDFLGKGHYCQVIKGKLRGKPDKIVAIKMLHDDENDQIAQSDLEKDEGRDSMFQEAQIMAKCKHKHVITFYGVQCDVPPVMIVMEYCTGGSLDIHLLKEKESISEGERLVYCYEAARGMRYLHYHKFIHRDLAARNCLISKNGIIKISDFGLSRSSDRGNGGDTSIKNIPLRWMAPETLSRTPNFSSKSDIWAYGVLAYEIYNLGIKPWVDEENQKKICHMIKHGPMPDLPERTPNPMKDLIHQCWAEIPSERPEFRDIVKGICKMVHDNPQMKFPKPAEFSVNKISGVYREETGSISTEEALGEKSVIFVSDLNTPQMLTSEESKETASRESKGSRDSAEDVTRGIRMTKKSAKSANERKN